MQIVSLPYRLSHSIHWKIIFQAKTTLSCHTHFRFPTKSPYYFSKISPPPFSNASMHLNKHQNQHNHSSTNILAQKSNFLITRIIMARLKILHLTIFVAMISTLGESQQPDLENKCGGCPCNNPCNPPPSPPPPALPPPSPPPPAPKKQPPPSNYCPPPPSGGGQYPPNPPYIYINGPPGNLYPVDQYYSGSGRSSSAGFTPFFITAVLGLIAFWWKFTCRRKRFIFSGR